jgi:hypothetical protein
MVAFLLIRLTLLQAAREVEYEALFLLLRTTEYIYKQDIWTLSLGEAVVVFLAVHKEVAADAHQGFLEERVRVAQARC